MNVKDVIKSKIEKSDFSKENFELDFNYLIGESLRERFSSFVIEIISKSRSELYEYNSPNLSGNLYFKWILASPEITSIFETARCFEVSNDQIDENKILCGSFQVFDTKWHVVKALNLTNKSEFIVGSSHKESKLCKFNLNNWIEENY